MGIGVRLYTDNGSTQKFENEQNNRATSMCGAILSILFVLV